MKKIVPASLILASCSLVSVLSLLFFGYRPQAGLVSQTESIVIKAPFDYAGDFSCGLGLVRIGRPYYLNDTVRWYYVDKAAKVMISPDFEPGSTLYPFSEGLAAVAVADSPTAVHLAKRYPGGGKFGYIDRTGKLVIKPRFDWAYAFSDGMARVRIGVPREGKFGFIDKTGTLAIQPRFVDARDFSEGFAIVNIGGKRKDGSVEGGKWGFVDTSGKVIIVPDADNIGDFCDGLARISVGEECGFVDKTGRIAIEPKFDYVKEFSEGMAAFEEKVNGPMQNGIWGYIDKSGNVVIEPKYSQAHSFSEGLAAVMTGSSRKGDCYNYIDEIGRVAIKTKYNVVGDFSEGLARVAIGVLWTESKGLDTTWGYIDKEGKTVIEPQFEWVGDFSQGAAWVDVHSTEVKYNYIDRAGKFIFDSVN
ncbi:MAG: WG repeat-containing protein [Planctomycetota bacterium]|jgi:hypothetical protein